MTRIGRLSTLSVVLSALLTAGCLPDAIRAGGPGAASIGTGYVVTADDQWTVWQLGRPVQPIDPASYRNRWPNRAWSNRISEQSQVWTKQGFILQELGFINGIEADGEIVSFNKKMEALRYRATMTDAEVAALISKLLAFGANDRFVVPPVTRTSVGGKDALHFVADYRIEFGLQHGLACRTAVYAFRDGDRLNFIYFTAPSLLYYERYWPEAEKIIKSARFAARG